MDRKTEPERASKPKAAKIPTDPDEIARLEARNALRQFDAVIKSVDEFIHGNRVFRLRPSFALDLNRLATEETNNYPGIFRPSSVEISDSQHVPPPANEVPGLVEDMCDYVNDNWTRTPIHLASYLMWRINWIHPFWDGNGRTARALSYAILCMRLGYRLPGVKTIPEQIVADKFPYYDALEAADRNWKQGKVDVSDLEKLLSDKLASQLLQIHLTATGEIR